MVRIYILVLSLFCITACTGSAYKLPAVTDSDVQAMHMKYDDKSNKPLKTYSRSDTQSKNLLQVATKRLTKNAKPLCEHAGYNSCRFDVVYDPKNEMNAYASEHDKITVYKGIMQYLKTNDEIAAVLAHEMGHHLANHIEEGTQNRKTGAAVSGVLTAVLIGLANANNPYYNSNQQQQDQKTIRDMMNLGAHIGGLTYSKEQEREADLLATYLLARAGYDLKKAENVMVVLAKFAGETNPDPSHKAFLESHPAGMERVVAWEKAIDEIKQNPEKLPYSKQERAQ